MKTITLTELKDKTLGKVGTPKRDKYEQELRVEILAAQIKQLRIERNLTQEQLGKLVGVQRAQISKMENNTGNVTISTLLKIFSALKAKVKFEIEKEQFELTLNHSK
ncbi:MAG: XRE family transcriptional regulator [Saprospirales bacterium]|jgi:HTH-type transcriptional regulator/antitoxin HipB|nr:MAG: XRE family transcriptional regulator [Saprospirales bacterium]